MANYMGPEAFRLSGGKKRPRIKEDGFLDFVRQLPCVACGFIGNTEAAHIRFACLQAGKGMTGAAIKPDDRFCIPLCRKCHADQHAYGEVAWWINQGVDPIYVSALLFSHFTVADHEAAVLVAIHARSLGRYQ